jgi:hypothetical protein
MKCSKYSNQKIKHILKSVMKGDLMDCCLSDLPKAQLDLFLGTLFKAADQLKYYSRRKNLINGSYLGLWH